MRSVMVMRPSDRFTITGLAGAFLKVGAASLLARAVEAGAALLLLSAMAAILFLVK